MTLNIQNVSHARDLGLIDLLITFTVTMPVLGGRVSRAEVIGLVCGIWRDHNFAIVWLTGSTIDAAQHVSKTYSVNKIDLFLEEDTGLWILNQIPDHHIERVVTATGAIQESARSRSLPVSRLNEFAFTQSNATSLLSVLCPRIFPQRFLENYTVACNLHPGYLPWGKGVHSPFWALWNGEPAGATLHILDAGIDTGNIVAQTQIAYDEFTFLSELSVAVDAALKELFSKYKEAILSGSSLANNPQKEPGTSYSVMDYSIIATTLRTSWRDMTGDELYKVFRCIPAFVADDGERLFVLRVLPQPRP